MRTFHKLFLFLGFMLATSMSAAIKIDFNRPGTNESQCSETDYTPWAIGAVATDSKTIDGVTITVRTADGTPMRSDWYKNGTQNKPGKLVNDGVTSDSARISLEVLITGLTPGNYGMQTYNNAWEAESYEFPPVNFYLNGQSVYTGIKVSNRVATPAEATCMYFDFTVAAATDIIKLTIEPQPGYTAQDPSKANGLYNRVFLNALEIGVGNAASQATAIAPLNNDLHYDCDGGAVKFIWSPAAGAVKHALYFGTDSAEVAASTTATVVVTDTTYVMNASLNSFSDYFWRVDETDEAGTVSKGEVWKFRARRDAFRGAEGYGRYAIGGRGGKVVHVTNLNDEGEGSFREALTNDIGPRTIVFDVSGVIELKSRLTQVGKYVTVAGQTAPGNGICFKAAPLGIGSESQWRFVRMRLGGGRTYDGIGMAGANFSILDHASISWTIDEAFSSRGAQNITLQRTLISEALNVAGHQNYSYGTKHGYAGSVGGNVGSLHHNLLAHCYGRNWSLAGGLDGDGYYAGKMDIFNTVVYNYGHRATDGGSSEVNFVGNYYKMGPATDIDFLLNAQLEGTGKGYQAYYYHNNIKASQSGSLLYDGTDDTKGRKYTLSGGQKLDWEVFVSQPWFESMAEVESAADAYKDVLSDVGCTMPVLDLHDRRVIRETINGTTSCKGSYTGLAGMPDKAADSDSTVTYTYYIEESRSADFDSDADGLPDWWESMIGTSTASAAGDFSDANADGNGDGWSNLEDYLDYMALPHVVVPNDAAVTFDLNELASGYGVATIESLSFERSAGFKAEIAQDTLAVVSIEPGVKGYDFLLIQGKDAAGSKIKRLVAVAAMDQNSPADLKTISSRPFEEVSVWDASGRLVSRSKSQSSLPSGLYLLNNGNETQKILVK